MQAQRWLPLVLLGLGAVAQAEVRCHIGGREIPVANAMADFNDASSGERASTGKLSRFRLLTLDLSAGPNSSVELKTVDVTAPGEYALSTEALWRSVVRVANERQKVTAGRFRFTHFEIVEGRGRAVGTVEFNTEATKGSCSFDLEFKGVNRDRLRGT